MSEQILVTRSSIPELDEYMNELKSIFDSHWLTNMGDKHKQFQCELQKFLGVEKNIGELVAARHSDLVIHDFASQSGIESIRSRAPTAAAFE